MKKELLRCLDKIPAYCQQLMFTSRSLAVGQSACCRKVSATCLQFIFYCNLMLVPSLSLILKAHSSRYFFLPFPRFHPQNLRQP